MPSVTYSICESSFAAPWSHWHIRPLTEAGRKHGGGIDTPSLCGRVTPPDGWDLEYSVVQAVRTPKKANLCKTCLAKFKEKTDPQPSA
jgi:hypothetical protein